METSEKISIAAIIISLSSLFISGYIGYCFANKSFKKQARLTEIKTLITNKNELINNLEALSVVGIQIATKEYHMQPDQLGEIPENLQEKYWTSVYEGHDFEELWLILGVLSKLNFEQILSKRDNEVEEQFRALKALRTNRYITKAERAHLVYQICFKKQLGMTIKGIDDEYIRKNFKSNL